jgi:hypothetical protein
MCLAAIVGFILGLIAGELVLESLVAQHADQFLVNNLPFMTFYVVFAVIVLSVGIMRYRAKSRDDE